MESVDFKGSNITLTKPEGWTDEQCKAIKAFKGKNDAGQNVFLTAWKPSEKDLEALNAGEPIYLNVLGEIFQPVAILH